MLFSTRENHGKEDDIKKLEDERLLKEDNWNSSNKDVDSVLTILTPSESGHIDPLDTSAMKH